jgi:hypothetical protein
MGWLVWAGTAATLAGVGGLVACMVHVWRLRRAGLPDADLRAGLGRALAWNMAALAVSVLGLMAVMMGLALR